MECEKSPDGKHHYKIAQMQHMVMNHCCYECVICGHGYCKHIPTPVIDPLSLPTEDQL